MWALNRWIGTTEQIFSPLVHDPGGHYGSTLRRLDLLYLGWLPAVESIQMQLMRTRMFNLLPCVLSHTHQSKCFHASPSTPDGSSYPRHFLPPSDEADILGCIGKGYGESCCHDHMTKYYHSLRRRPSRRISGCSSLRGGVIALVWTRASPKVPANIIAFRMDVKEITLGS